MTRALKQEICDLFDTTNLTVRQVAERYHITVKEVKRILLEN